MSARQWSESKKAEVKKQALKLRNAGAPYRDIASTLGITAATAHRWVTELLTDIPAEEAATLRRTEVERLDRLQRAVWSAATSGDIHAVREAVRIIDRRCKLLGLDAPTQVDIGIGNADIAATSKKILAEILAETNDPALAGE